MSFLKNFFNKNKSEERVHSNEEFWNWFIENEVTFHHIVSSGGDIETGFFDKMSPKLDQLREGYWLLIGMADDHTAELIISVDGAVKNIVFAEELIAAAPALNNWKFTALKPAINSPEPAIRMGDHEFSKEELSFYALEDATTPDEIDLVFVHKDLNENNRDVVINGTYIFLDNYLGELNFTTLVDNVRFTAESEAEKELIPILKLKDFLIWREKEFVEKYEGVRYTDEEDAHSAMEGTLSNGLPLVAIVNTTLLEWEAKASHPWILNITLKYDGSKNNGMPNNEVYDLMNAIEDELLNKLPMAEGFLNIGRETADGVRELYIACKSFRKASKIVDAIQQKYISDIEMGYDLYKDKYWKTFDRFRPML